MKILGLLSVFLAFSAQAEDGRVSGRASLTIWPSYSSGYYSMEVRQEGDKIIGQTSFGRNSMVSLTVQEGKYTGVAGGDGMTDLECKANECKGLVGGKSTRFKIDENSGAVKGALNFNRLRVERTEDSITIRSLGALELKLSRHGHFEGTGFLNSSPNSRFTARFESSGTLEGLSDTGLLVILLASPLAGN